MISPEDSPSSNVRNARVSCPDALTTGNTVRFSYVMGSSRRQSSSAFAPPEGAPGLDQTNPNAATPRAVNPQNPWPIRLNSERSIPSSYPCGGHGSVVRTRQQDFLAAWDGPNCRRQGIVKAGNRSDPYELLFQGAF